jgi:hypothetical protein
MPRLPVLAVSLAAALLGGCDMLGIETPEKVAAAREAEGKAVGGACRHAGRAIEDCYALNKRVEKAAIFAGWRDMNDYMRENKIEPVPPQIAGKPTAPGAATHGPDAEGDAAPAAKSKVAGAKPREARHEGS